MNKLSYSLIFLACACAAAILAETKQQSAGDSGIPMVPLQDLPVEEVEDGLTTKLIFPKSTTRVSDKETLETYLDQPSW